MNSQKPYGGAWTQEKLKILNRYLTEYMKILRKHAYFSTVYVDAFAGSGTITPRSHGKQIKASEYVRSDRDAEIFLKGSARVALEINPAFGRYVFIESDTAKCQELEQLRVDYPEQAKRIQIINADATAYLTSWCLETNWSRTRAVVFLDPFGMQVEWSLLKTIAGTKSIDLWLLVPLWIGANRLLTKDEMPPPEWEAKLTRFFGTDEWKERFYGPKIQRGLFDRGDEQEKRIDHEALNAYFVDRLNDLFPGGVAKNPLVQRNSRNSPLFLLCFATANPKKSVQKAALGIAEWLLKE